MATPFAALAELGERLSATRSRLALSTLIADFLTSLESGEVAPGARLIIGRVFPEGDARVLNLNGSAVVRVLQQVTGSAEGLWQASSEAVDFGEAVQAALIHARHVPQGEPLGLLEVYHAFEDIAGATGPGSRERKDDLLAALLRRSSPLEAKCLVKTVVGEMRHGASEGMVLDGIARASDLSPALVRRANQSAGDLGLVAALALSQGAEGLDHLPPRPGQPLKPMLAQAVPGVADAFRILGNDLALEYKLDGARIQIHKDGDSIRLFSRNLADLSDSLPDVVDLVRANIRARQLIMEGEVIAVSAAGRPLPFQTLMQRLGRVRDIADAAAATPVHVYLFDLLFLEGRSLLDTPYRQRWQTLSGVCGAMSLAPRCLPDGVTAGEAFLRQARAGGHEGVMAKALTSAYQPGARGQGWLKIKPVVTLDLVVVAADWGYGRRHGWLSNYHLAARDEAGGDLLVVGKTFKGPTDAEFKAMTERLLALKVAEHRGTVSVRPEIVAEVAFNNIQKSPHYRSGMALRFARIVRFRDDKPATEADTIQTMRAIYERMEDPAP